MPVGGGVRLRVQVQALATSRAARRSAASILAREVSHEPVRRKLDEIVDGLVGADGGAARAPCRRASATSASSRASSAR